MDTNTSEVPIIEPKEAQASVTPSAPPIADEVKKSSALLDVGDSMTPEMAQKLFDKHGEKIKKAVDDVQAYLMDLFDKQGIEEPGITSNILLPDNLVTWSQGAPYIRGYSDAAIPLAYVNFSNEAGTGSISIWFNWDTEVVTTSLDG